MCSSDLAVGDHRTGHRPDRVDIEVPGRAVQTVGPRADQGFGLQHAPVLARASRAFRMARAWGIGGSIGMATGEPHGPNERSEATGVKRLEPSRKDQIFQARRLRPVAKASSRKLKVFRAQFGFHDMVVAGRSRAQGIG